MDANKIFFILTTNDPTKVTRCFQFAKIALSAGVFRGIMLIDDAVYITNPQIAENIVAPTGDKLMLHLRDIVESEEFNILCCKPCCITRNISVEDLPPGFVLSTGIEAMSISSEPNVNTITF